jgi:serine/threonine protein kinase
MIPSRPPPTFKDMSRWTPALNDFVSKCLVKNPDARSTATELLNVIFHSLSVSPFFLFSFFISMNSFVMLKISVFYNK